MATNIHVFLPYGLSAAAERRRNRGALAPGLVTVAAAISYRETGDPFSGVTLPEPHKRACAPALVLRRAPADRGLYAARRFRPGDRVLELDEVTWRSDRDRDTVEHPFGGHMFHPVLAKAAHSCAPNCQVSFPDRALVATSAIASGDAVTIDYQSTDRRISRPFDCHCGSRGCRGQIGFAR
jgi:hypothetical protein